ncbi:MAG TPA: hypothetical protein VFK02_32115 [Kofleriaceae bacterium]|nr:hypothetical protein [Kofleriaceae bacterium]
MQTQPVRALITRDDDDDPMHEPIHDVPGVLPAEPQVGAPLQLFLESGKLMRTSTVKRVARRGSELVVDTANSRYRLKLSNAA